MEMCRVTSWLKVIMLINSPCITVEERSNAV
jgi:hypothetical protein